MLPDGAGGEDANTVPDLPNDLAAMSTAMFALRGPEAAAYRALAGEYLVLAVEVEHALDVLLSMWFIEMDRELFSEFDAILQRIGLERKAQTVRRLVKNQSAGAGALLARVDRVQRLRNKIAHQSPRIEHGVVHFLDGSLTAEQFEAEIKDAQELSLELLDKFFPQVIERRRRWGARDADETGPPSPDVSHDDLPPRTEEAEDTASADITAKPRRRRRVARRRPADSHPGHESTPMPDE